VFIDLWNNTIQAGDLQNWLMRLARNLIIDDYRRRQRTPHDSHAEDWQITPIICARATVRCNVRWNGESWGTSSGGDR